MVLTLVSTAALLGLSLARAETGAALTDPVAYCQSVGTIDAPDAKYKGPAVPDWMVAKAYPPEAIKARKSAGMDPAKTIVWRCASGAVLMCVQGNSPQCDWRKVSFHQEQAQAPQTTAPPGAAPVGLPQTPIAAAALIMLVTIDEQHDISAPAIWQPEANRLKIKVLDDDHADFVFMRNGDNYTGGHFARLSPCLFRLSQYTTGRVKDINFENLSRESSTMRETRTDTSSCISYMSGNCIQYNEVPNGLTTLIVKGRHEQGKYPLCEGKVAVAEAKQSQTEETIHLLPGGKCDSDLQIGHLDADTLARVNRALNFISTQSCPLSPLPF